MAINQSIEILVHFDKYLHEIIIQYGIFVYGLLFLIIFIETGLVIMPFLPGDSLLFVAGSFAAIGSLNIFILLAVLSFAAILGDSANYWLGYKFGRKLFKSNRYKCYTVPRMRDQKNFLQKFLGFLKDTDFQSFKNKICLNEEYLKKTEHFYEKHGSKAIIIARFNPILRTFAPFVAGIGKMNYKKFLSYNIIEEYYGFFCLFLEDISLEIFR